MANPDNKQNIKDVTAYARGVHISPRKARLVANLVKKMPVAEALEQLEFTNKRAAGLIKKLVNSAVANASHNFQITEDRLFIKSLTVDGGPVSLRYQPRAQGRALPIRKQTSHFSLVLGVAANPLKKAGVKRTAVSASVKKEAPAEPAPTEAKSGDEKKSRFGFFRRKDKSQSLPQKEDVKGKGRVNIDRRSGS